MELIQQNIDDLISNLSTLTSSWKDDTAQKVITQLESLPQKLFYTEEDLIEFLDTDFEVGLLIIRLFLGLSKDELETELTLALGKGIGVKRFLTDTKTYLGALIDLGILEAMAQAVNYKPVWSDILVERLRSTRGKAIRGQRRGRGLEDFAENIVRDVFGDQYETRCSFVGTNGELAKCDFAIPNKQLPRILIESKGYGATGSKMSDVIGDLNTIIRNKRHDTTLILFTDGVTWTRRMSDFDKIIKMQNRGEISRIYTSKMAEAFRRDLHTLKEEYRL